MIAEFDLFYLHLVVIKNAIPFILKKEKREKRTENGLYSVELKYVHL